MKVILPKNISALRPDKDENPYKFVWQVAKRLHKRLVILKRTDEINLMYSYLCIRLLFLIKVMCINYK